MKIAIIITLLCLIFANHAEAAEIYQWTNAKGESVYSQTPPTDGSAIATVTSVEDPITETTEAQTEVAQNSDAATLETAKKMDNCEIARTNIALLRVANPQTQFTAADGEDVTYTQAELNSRIRSNQEVEKAWCEE